MYTYTHIHIHMYALCTEATGDNMFHMCCLFSKRNGLCAHTVSFQNFKFVFAA